MLREECGLLPSPDKRNMSPNITLRSDVVRPKGDSRRKLARLDIVRGPERERERESVCEREGKREKM